MGTRAGTRTGTRAGTRARAQATHQHPAGARSLVQRTGEQRNDPCLRVEGRKSNNVIAGRDPGRPRSQGPRRSCPAHGAWVCAAGDGLTATSAIRQGDILRIGDDVGVDGAGVPVVLAAAAWARIASRSPLRRRLLLVPRLLQKNPPKGGATRARPGKPAQPGPPRPPWSPPNSLPATRRPNGADRSTMSVQMQTE